MAKITALNGLYSLGARGKFGKPNGLGQTFFGWTDLGDDQIRSGYYQYHWNQHAKYYNRCIFYTHKIHTSAPAVARKNVFRDAMISWQVLSPEEKMVYNKMRYPYAQTGHNRFLSQYLKTH